MAETRTEHDLIGAMDIAASDLRGIHTHRALENFSLPGANCIGRSLSGRAVRAELVRAYALVKKACALANLDTGWLDGRRAHAIMTACDEIADGSFAECFGTDALQGGAGTSTNMNLNEVIANRANVMLGLEPGNYTGDGVHPLDHVNLHQSTNDTYPTALKVCVIGMLRRDAESSASLQNALQKREREFADIVTTGRTELQDAVPMTLGAIFSGLAEAAGRDRWRTFKCEERIRTVNLGGTAVGTGLAAPRDYIFRATDALREITGYHLARAENLVEATANADSFAEIAGILSAQAANLIKIARDIRLLAHEGDITLPAVQAGSSIMPGKVNPVICEAAIQAGMRARADCALVTEAVAHGTLQINEYLPLVADSMLGALELLANASALLASLVEGISANAEACRARVDENPVIVTAFLPHIGYERAQGLLAEWRAMAKGQSATGGASATRAESVAIRAFLEEKLGKDLVDRVLSPEGLSMLGFSGSPRRNTNHE